MSWAVGYDRNWHRDIGYGVPSVCDSPKCSEQIDRGLAHVCGGDPKGGERGCGLYFCSDHLTLPHSLCSRCRNRRPPYQPKPDTLEWINHKLTDESWQPWRDENPDEVRAASLSAAESLARARATEK